MKDRNKFIAALVLLGIGAFLFVRSFRSDKGLVEKSFFYDLSEKKLFTGPRTAVPPIRGLNDGQRDAVRAVVISTNGQPADKSSWTIAYLEMYSPELQSQMEAAQASGGSPAMSRTEALAHRLVRRLTDAEWFPMNSPEAEKIVSDWATPGPNGITPVVCAP